MSIPPASAPRPSVMQLAIKEKAALYAAYIPLFFKENIFGVRAGIQYTPSCDDHILAWDFTF